MTDKLLQNKSKNIRKDILVMAYKSHGAHISSSLCIADILTVLYWDVMKINPKKPNDPKYDRFILSKGHAAMALYAILAQKGFFPKKILEEYRKDGSLLGDHPIFGIPGIELATGSLGHGLSVAVGMALASKLNKKDNRIFVLVSDAECQEGTVWEAVLLANQLKLDNLTLLVDYNKLQALGQTKDIINLDPLVKKFKSFGWNSYNIDGNNVKDLKKYLNKKNHSSPLAIICNTIGGKGVSFMENNFEWHYKNMDADTYKKAMNEVAKL